MASEIDEACALDVATDFRKGNWDLDLEEGRWPWSFTNGKWRGWGNGVWFSKARTDHACLARLRIK
jgi:hypothetical protein